MECRGCDRKEAEIVRLEQEGDRVRRVHSAYRRSVEERDEFSDVDVRALKQLLANSVQKVDALETDLDAATATVELYKSNEKRNIEVEIERKRIVTDIRDRSVAIDAEMDEMRTRLATVETTVTDWYAVGQRCKHILLRWTAQHNSESRDVMVRATADLLGELEELEQRL